MQLTGDLNQQKRFSNYEKFSSEESALIFATDVIARGIDFDQVDWIVQVDAPQDPNFYIHRIGRTARKGRKGSVGDLQSSQRTQNQLWGSQESQKIQFFAFFLNFKNFVF